MAQAGLMPPEPVREDLIVIASPPDAEPAPHPPGLEEPPSGPPLPEWMAEWAREDALPPPPAAPVPVELPEEPPAPREDDTHILQPEQIFGGPASPAPVTMSHPISEEFSASLDDEIEKLMNRTRRFVKAETPPARPPQPAFEMPFGTPTPPPMKAPPREVVEDMEEGVDRGQVLEEMARSAPPAPVAAPPPAPEVKKKPSRPPSPAWEPPPFSSGLSTAGAASAPPPPPRAPAPPRSPERGKVRDTARRVKRALTPILGAGIDPASPWLSLVILMAGMVWIATGIAARSAGFAVVGTVLILPVLLSGIAAGRGPARK